jgi:hypothetical protein
MLTAFDALATMWFQRYGGAPFTAQTLMAASDSSPELRRALLSLAPSEAHPGEISQNKLTRTLRGREHHTASTIYVLLPSGEGIWRFTQNDLVDVVAA